MAKRHDAALSCALAVEAHGRGAALAVVTLMGHRVDGHDVVDGVLASPAVVTEGDRAIAALVPGLVPNRLRHPDRESSYEIVDEFGRLALASPDATAWIVEALRAFAVVGGRTSHPGAKLLHALQAPHTTLFTACEIIDLTKADGRKWIPWSADPQDRDGQMWHHLRAVQRARMTVITA